MIFHRADVAAVVWRGPVLDAWRTQFGGLEGYLGFPTKDVASLYQPDNGLPTVTWLELELGALV